jgi:plastocyanin
MTMAVGFCFARSEVHRMRRLAVLVTGLRRGPRWAGLLGLACGLVLVASGLALGANDTVTASSSTGSYTGMSNTPSIPGGGTLDFRNTSAATSHSVTASLSGPDGRPLFDSGVFAGHGGTTRLVKGVQYLAPGSYKFHCTIHPTTMKGTLTVPGGSPVARPKIEVSILSGRIGKVRRTKALKVEVDATTKSDNVALVAKKGSKTLARKSNVDLGAGDSRRILMRLAKKGRRALKGRSRATVKLKGTVPFGAPASDTRTLK